MDFRNTIIIMTSNIGSQEILSYQEKEGEHDQMKTVVLGMLRQHFRPEFLNRVDEVIVFHVLEHEQIARIALLLLERLQARLLESASLRLEWEREVVDYLAEKGYDPTYGARPLKRVIQQEVETPLSRKIVAGETKPDGTVLMRRGDRGGIKFEC